MPAMRGFLPRTLAVLLRAAYAALPALKGWLPKPLQRFLLLNVLGAQRGYPDISRQALETEILPSVARRYAQILFVGTASYTYWYERLFRPGQLTTIDSRPGEAVWGVEDHIVAPVQNIGRYRSASAFDCVVLNGVFGFGVDDPATMRAVAEALHRALQPDGCLVLGWNHDMQEDPDKLGTFDGLFNRSAELRRTFPGETHVYDFYRRL